MLYPKRSDFDLFDSFNNFWDIPKEKDIMKTDIKEHKNNYIIEIDLPGYDKSDIQIEVVDGYLTVSASKTENKEEHSEGHFVRKERYVGKCSRSFYVGKDLDSEEIKATFKNGTLTLDVPKKDKEELPNKKYVEISD